MERQWAGVTFGNGWMHRNLVRLLRYADVRLIYLFADIFVVPVCLLLNRSRKTSYSYFRDILGYGRWKSVRSVYVNHCMFAQTVIDKFAMYAGRRFDVEIEGMDRFCALAAREDGFLMLSAHIGNYEIAGYTFRSERKTINPVVYADEKASVMANRNKMFGKTNVSMITLGQDMDYLFEINRVLDEGNIVSFPSDRFMGSSRSVDCVFLGRTARFPQGPFRVAAMRGLDVLAVNVLKTGLKKYMIYVTPIDYDRTAERKEQTRQLAEGYVAELEKRLRQYPTQWYNFYDFWQ